MPDPSGLTEEERTRVCEQVLAQAERLRRERRHKEGIDLLVDVLRYGVLRSQVYFRLGNLYFDAGDLSRAEYAYQRAIQEEPHHASAHHNLGVVYRRQGRIDQSVRMLKRARRLEVRHPPQANLSEEQKRAAKRLALPMMAVPLLIVGLIVLIVYLVSRFI